MGWTKEQQQAIEQFGHNILVSAGAGSGKTAVLTARVMHHLKQGMKIEEMLILTFTKAAAAEMKERIRLAIKKEGNLSDALNNIDQAYITTFDSFALSIVKKYHYLLNLPSNPSITDDPLLKLLKKRCMSTVFTSLYEQEDQEFLEMIDNFCGKDDEELQELLLTIAQKLEEIYDISNYLDNLYQKYLEPLTLNDYLTKYEQLVKQEYVVIKEEINRFSHISPKEYLEKINITFAAFEDCQTYDDFYALKSIKLPILPRGVDEEVKFGKEKINNELKKLKDLLRHGPKETMEDDYRQMNETILPVISILKKYFQIYNEEKTNCGYFDFQTIAMLALKILEEYPFALDELKNSFQEIMVDEYQDTNDIQEKFLQLLGKDNIYMVGDIKQSIYRFRNANPSLFKAKYLSYTELQGGEKIDLVKNFRSRKEVLNNINLIFNPIMDQNLGGADYFQTHQMVFGNLNYDLLDIASQSHQMQILTYPTKIEEPFSNAELEAFLIGRDIQKRINEKEQVVDKATNNLRNITYQDFCILIDRTREFPLYRRIFHYLGIPLTVLKDEVLSTNIHFLTIKHCFVLLNKLATKEYDYEFRLSLISLMRSFLFEESDTVIHQIFNEKKYFETTPIQVLKTILPGINSKNLTEIYDEILEKTDYYNHLLSIGDIEQSLIVLTKLKEFTKNAAQIGYSYQDFSNYLNETISSNLEIKYSYHEDALDSVKIMTIHKSKGLEFPYCYFSGLDKKFNIREMKERFIWDKKYGLTVPIMKEGIKECFVKDLIKSNYVKEEISERIRLLYVALTRAKEKMIFVTPSFTNEEISKEEGIIVQNTRLAYRSFFDTIKSISSYIKDYLTPISLEDISPTKKYLQKKTIEDLHLESQPIVYNEKPLSKEIISKETYSKTNINIISEEEYQNIQLGLKFHEILEDFDFHHPNFSLCPNSFWQEKLKQMYQQNLIQDNLNSEFYQEYEFFFNESSKISHGIIDLFIVTPTKVILIDYKLKYVLDNAYLKQLKGYKEYLETQFTLPIETYLYSILDGKFTFISI